MHLRTTAADPLLSRVSGEGFVPTPPAGAAAPAPPQAAGSVRSAKITPMRAAEPATDAAGTPESGRDRLVARLANVQAQIAKAKELGVDPAKKTFAMKVFKAAVAALLVAATAALVAATGGAALIPAAIALGCVALAFTIKTADAGLAYMELCNARAAEKGLPKPYELPPVGANSVAVVLYKLFTAGGMAPEKAKSRAVFGGDAVLVLLDVTATVLTLGAGTAVNAAAESARIATTIGNVVTVFQSLTGLLADTGSAEVSPEAAATLNDQLDAILRDLEGAGLPDPDRKNLTAMVEAVRKDASELNDEASTDSARAAPVAEPVKVYEIDSSAVLAALLGVRPGAYRRF
ncbi:MAG TPA: hypothetical protein VHA82_21830 [Ramlibacter sp.]|uniref:hypothetical protein n=1 Tax=Ramlibacter sp. TaxID=1917967 RepID=UPI002CA296CD|nr:hypothetical protein [Ramlibacter sp.]HVZ46461.1 hypothetical protein [Ramlibacter sp.]